MIGDEKNESQFHISQPSLFNDLPIDKYEEAQLDFPTYADALARIIASQKTLTPFTIGINGEWGTGKTTLMRLIKNRLDAMSQNAERVAGFRVCKTVWFNAWKYGTDEIYVALINEILKQMKKDGFITRLYAEMADPKQAEIKIPEALIHLMTQAFSLGAIDIDLSRYEVESKFKSKLAFLDEFSEVLDRLLNWYVTNKRVGDTIDEREGILAIFIDDLDRCLPAKTIQVLETIKLFMDKQGCVFVLGADSKIVTRAIDAHYIADGMKDINSQEYLEKIVQVRFDLPPISSISMQVFVSNLPGIDGTLRANLRLIVENIKTNPRKIKTFINYIEIQWAIIVSAGLDKKMKKGLLIEWLVLSTVSPNFCQRLKGLSSGEDKANLINGLKSYFLGTYSISDDLTFDTQKHMLYKGGTQIDLTALEYKLLECLYNSGGIVSKSEIVDKVYGYEAGGDINDAAIDRVVQRLRAKIGEHYIQTARGMGYSLNLDRTSKEKSSDEVEGKFSDYKDDAILANVLRQNRIFFDADTIDLYIHLREAPSLASQENQSGN